MKSGSKPTRIALALVTIILAGFVGTKLAQHSNPDPSVAPDSSISPSQAIEISRVIDGDTVIDQAGQSIRLIGIDAPERGQPHYQYAKDTLSRLLESTDAVTITYDLDIYDQYGRTLGYLWADGIFINEQLMLWGAARVMTIPPNSMYQDKFLRAESIAKEARRGIWQNQ